MIIYLKAKIEVIFRRCVKFVRALIRANKVTVHRVITLSVALPW